MRDSAAQWGAFVLFGGGQEFDRLVRQYDPLIRKWIAQVRGLREPDECRQIALIALWEAARRYQPEKGPFPAYAQAVVRGRLLSELRRRRRREARFVSTDPALLETAAPAHVVQDGLWLDEAMRTLSKREKQWVQAALVHDLPTAAIAELYGVSQDTVRSWKKSTIKKLRAKRANIRPDA